MDQDIIMPFGKHKGKRVSELPERYLRWLLDNVQMFAPLERAVKSRLGLALPETESVEDRIDRIVKATQERLRKGDQPEGENCMWV